ncbi:methyl-accepting chemotaxis protein [Sphingomonas elodea]|uniref:methyl-accepting chemotaxis protein n=1 Tax=Sphingomonas elodea TaxID=179878 RepID=UPI001872BF19|nr:methyl-accepting chemotaxis protein [Sphingomonas elodea]
MRRASPRPWLVPLLVTAFVAVPAGVLTGVWGAAWVLLHGAAMLALLRVRAAPAQVVMPECGPACIEQPPPPMAPPPPARGRDDARDRACYFDTLRGQIAGAQADAERGVTGVIEQTIRLHQTSSRQQALLQRSLDDGAALLRAAERPEQILRTLTEILDRSAAERAGDHARLEALAESTARLRPAADAIAKISDRAVLLSYNAAVEAGRAGAAGGSFGVVADQVRALAESIAAVAKTLGGELDAIARRMREELLASRTGAATGIPDVTKLTAELAGLHEDVGASGQTLLALIHEIGGNHGRLVDGLSTILGDLQFHDVLRQRMEHVTYALDQLEAHLDAPDDASGPDLAARLRALQDHYVMESERQVQAIAQGEPAAVAAAPRIQLF